MLPQHNSRVLVKSKSPSCAGPHGGTADARKEEKRERLKKHVQGLINRTLPTAGVTYYVTSSERPMISPPSGASQDYLPGEKRPDAHQLCGPIIRMAVSTSEGKLLEQCVKPNLRPTETDAPPSVP